MRLTKALKMRLTKAQKKRWLDRGANLLVHAADVHEQAKDLDTAVRDSVAIGLAYLVHAAFDCRSIALEFPDIESVNAFIDTSTAQWFRDRGYVEWFSAGAAQLFHTTPPRRIAPIIRVRRTATARRVRAKGD